MPAMTARPYGGGILSLLNKQLDGDSDTLKVTLHTSSYVPDFDNHQFASSLSNELSTGGGYTAGGLTVTGATLAKTAANSWSASWTAATAYTTGQYVRPATGNGYIYRASVGGTTGGAAPTWPTVQGTTVVDGSVTWTVMGTGAVALSVANPTWAAFSAGPLRYAILADYATGVAATSPLILCWAFNSDNTGGGGSFSITTDISGVLILPY